MTHKKRILKVEEVGDFWRKQTFPRIRLKGKWLEKAGILPEELEPYGGYKAKVSLDVFKRLRDRPDGKLILVTAMTATRAGEGKTVPRPLVPATT